MFKILLWFLVCWFAGCLVQCKTDLFDNHHQSSTVISFLCDLIEEVKTIAFGQSDSDVSETESVYSSMKNNVSMNISDFTRELPETNKTRKKKKKMKTGHAGNGVAIASGVIGIVSFSLFTLVALAVVAGKSLLVGTVALVMSSFSGMNSYQNKV